MLLADVFQMGKGALLPWQALQQDFGLRKKQTAWQGSTNFVSCSSSTLEQGLYYASLSGEASKLVIDEYLRSLAHGNKYVFQSLPKILTLWLEHASTVNQPFDPKRGDNE